MMYNDISELIKNIKHRMELVAAMQKAGYATKEFEVDKDCFVQLLQWVDKRLLYHQLKVSSMLDIEQEQLIGMFHNEMIGDVKIIGIYKLASEAEGEMK